MQLCWRCGATMAPEQPCSRCGWEPPVSLDTKASERPAGSEIAEAQSAWLPPAIGDPSISEEDRLLWANRRSAARSSAMSMLPAGRIGKPVPHVLPGWRPLSAGSVAVVPPSPEPPAPMDVPALAAMMPPAPSAEGGPASFIEVAPLVPPVDALGEAAALSGELILNPRRGSRPPDEPSTNRAPRRSSAPPPDAESNFVVPIAADVQDDQPWRPAPRPPTPIMRASTPAIPRMVVGTPSEPPPPEARASLAAASAPMPIVRSSLAPGRPSDAPPLTHCPKCESVLHIPNPLACDSCGFRLSRTRPPESIFRHSKCPRCGHKNKENVFLCTNCGEQVMKVEKG